MTDFQAAKLLTTDEKTLTALDTLKNEELETLVETVIEKQPTAYVKLLDLQYWLNCKATPSFNVF